MIILNHVASGKLPNSVKERKREEKREGRREKGKQRREGEVEERRGG